MKLVNGSRVQEATFRAQLVTIFWILAICMAMH
jgi:hypothetical protein